MNHSVKLHNLVRSLLFCNVIQCLLLITDVLGLTVHPETSVNNYQSDGVTFQKSEDLITPQQKPQIVQGLVNHELCRGHMETSKILFTNSQARNIDNYHNHFFWERKLEIKKNMEALSNWSS